QEMKRFELKVNSLIMSCSGTIGRVSIVPPNIQKGIINQALLMLTPIKNLDTFFLKLLMESDFFQNILSEYTTGAAISNVASVKVLKEIKIPLPPLEEQMRIVEKLDGLFAKIDKSIALLDVNIASANALMPSALNEVFEELGEKWEKKKLNQISINHDGKRIPIKEDKRVKNINGYPYYGASGIVDYVDDYIFDGEYLLISEDGANLVIRKTPIAFIANGKFWVNNHAHIVQAIHEITSNKYLEYFFAYVDISLYITGAAQPKLSQKKLFEIPIIIPPLDIQTQTVAYLDALHVKVEALKKVQATKKAKLLALKASLLESAFKGEL
ncbi:MAG: restriction endonuclease subunit S, partial [Campylobacterales bacterium]|nr:restriction endonuclease subunit S [Campylobacterales bacterium]